MSGAGDNPLNGESSVGVDVLGEAAFIFPLLIATGAGLHSIVRAAMEIQNQSAHDRPQLVLFGAEDALPFRARPSTILVPGMPDGVIACVPQLEEFGVPSRLASTSGLPGCYDGPVIELAELWLKSLVLSPRARIQILVSGDEQTVRSVGELGQRMGWSVRVIPPESPSP
jgi:hypothetical protein